MVYVPEATSTDATSVAAVIAATSVLVVLVVAGSIAVELWA